MAIRPVDMQLVIQKNQEVHQAKQTVVSKLDNELMQAQTKNKEESIKRHQTVNQLERSELRRVKNDTEDDNERNKRHGKQNDSEHEKEAHEKELNNKVKKAGTHFDMKV